MEIKCFESIFHQIDNGESSDSSWNRSDRISIFKNFLKTSITINLSVNHCKTNIDNNSFFLYHFFCKKSWFSCCKDDDISIFGMIFEIFCFTITASYSCSGINTHIDKWFSDNIASSDDSDIFSLKINSDTFANMNNS